jgi:FG-GAP-like repeat
MSGTVRGSGWPFRLRLLAVPIATAAGLVVLAVLPVFAQSPLPDGGTARAGGSGIVSAHFVAPTSRYRHGVLGDAIEAGGLSVRDAAGRTHVYMLREDSVFEDITPRLADLDGDGGAEAIVVRSYLSRGAALAVFGLRDGELVRIAETSPIGQPARWLNPAGIADFTGDGRPEIAIVKTPHIGGRLEIWSLRADRLSRIAALEGFSNHVIGSRALGLSAVADVDGDGVQDLILPDASRQKLVAVSVAGGRARTIGSIELPGAVVSGLSASGQSVAAGLAGGRRVSVRLADFRS